MLIVFSLAGTLVSGEPWQQAHEQWFLAMAEELEDPGLAAWGAREDYFGGVDEIMVRRMPGGEQNARVRVAREEYFALVRERLDESVVNEEVASLVRDLSMAHAIGVVTSSLPDVAARCVELAGLSEVVSAIGASLLEERDDKLAVVARFISEHGTPAVYVGRGREDVRTFCEQEGIAYVSVEEHETLAGLRDAIMDGLG